MARVTCAISGMRFECSYFESLNVPHTEGYIHPVFAIGHKQLHRLYSLHCRGQLTSNDSYLLFMAFIHSSEKVTWKHPAACNPNEVRTKQLIENNLAQLVSVLEKTALIQHPHFSQPSFNITYENASLEQIRNWIRAWEDNIKDFYVGRADAKTQQALVRVENRLGHLILSGESPEKFSHVIAEWADKAAEFPEAKAEEYKRTIRTCFNTTKMFNTPLSLLKEIKEYCESNIEVGSIHFHTLSHVLKKGINNHIDYLGGTSLVTDYTLLSPTLGDKKVELKNSAEIAALAAKAPQEEPKSEDYASSLEFLRAKLAYRVAAQQQVAANNINKESEL